MQTSRDEFHELSFYTLSHPDSAYFIHQHIVDAFQAQTADANTKPIGLIFSLVGLYLYCEKNYSGRQVQLAHMQMAQNKKPWPKIELPADRGEITVSEVLKTPEGQMRDDMIREWCKCVWLTYHNSHASIAKLGSSELNVS